MAKAVKKKKAMQQGIRIESQASQPNASLMQLFQQARYREIILLWSKANNLPHDNPQQAFVVAASHFRLNEFDQCLQLLLAIEAQMQQDAGYYSLLGATCRRLGMIDRAERYLKIAIELDPANPDFKNNYANLLIDKEEYNLAEKVLDEVISSHPQHQDAVSNQQRLFALVSSQPSKLFKEDISPRNTTSWELPDPLLAAFDESLISLKSTNEKSDQAEKAHKKTKPGNADINLPRPGRDEVAAEQLRLVPTMINEERYKTAFELLSSAHQAYRMVSPEIFLNASDAFTKLQRFNEAELCLLHALALGNKSFANYANLVSLSLIRGDCKLAAHYFKQAAEIEPADARLEVLREQIRTVYEQKGRTYNFATDWHQSQPK